jgi:serine/threonine protein kinase
VLPSDDPTFLGQPIVKKTVVEGARRDRPEIELGSDFETLSLLGEGSGGSVYLARQRSLNRLVALKVVPDAGTEANTLAKLEHENIVTVFSETVEAERNRRIICMQYVPGTTLSKVIEHLADQHKQATGGAILRAIEELSDVQVPLDPALRAERAELERADAVTTICRIGAALARALGHAHARGVVHRDIKPGNILLTPYGRPMLVDFNIAVWGKTRAAAARSDAQFGATLSYASPEQLLAFAKRLPRESVDSRTDLYALAVVLFELLTGERPFPGKITEDTVEAHQVARKWPLKRVERPEQSAYVLERTLRRCLAVDPARRYASVGDMAASLDACAALRSCEKELPAAGPVTRWAQRWPMITLFIAGVAPNLVGTVVNAFYVTAVLRRGLSEAQMQAYFSAAFIYCVVTFPLATAAVAIVVRQAALRVAQLAREGARPTAAIEARRMVLALPTWLAMTSFVSWCVAVPFFPWFIDRAAGPMPSASLLHAGCFVMVCGVIGFCYTNILTLQVALRVILPWATIDGRDLGAELDLAALPPRLRVLQLLSASALPTSAVTALAFWPDPMGPSVRAMLGALLWVGAIGATGAMYAAGEAMLAAQHLDRIRSRVAK